jgi:pilus assembly protein CpaF
VHESVAPGGPVVNITLPTEDDPRWSLEMLIGAGSISPMLANLLSTCVHAGLNIAICAGAGASAFPLLAALCEAAPAGQRQVIVRPTRARGLLPPDAVVLEGDGLVGTDGATVMQALVRTALGLVPQRLLVHEIVGPEAAEVFAAMGRGLGGTVVSTRAPTGAEGLSRLSSLAAMASPLADASARTRLVASSIELMLTVGRFADGITRVTEVAEPTLSSGVAQAVEIVRYDGDNRQWRHSGVVPTFFGDLQRRGYPVDAGMLGS